MITNFEIYLLTEKVKEIDFEMLYEKAKTKTAYQHKALVNKTVKDYKLNVYFASTFGTAVAYLIPVIESLFYNSGKPLNIGAYEIVLLTVFAIAEILSINSDGIKKLRETLKEKGLIGLVQKIKDSLLSIYKITAKVGEAVGKTMERFIEMFGYVSIGIPIWQTLIEITQQEGFNIDTLPQKIIGLSVGAGTFYLKNLVNRIIELLSKKINPNENKEIK